MRDEDIRCLLSFVAHFDWLSPHNRSTFQRCLHTYVNLSSGCNTFMSRLAQSQPGTHLNVHKCETKTFVVCCYCCTLRLTVSTQSQHFSTMFAYLCKLVEWMQHFYELVSPESAWHTSECTEMRDEDIRCLLSFAAHFDWLSPHNRSTFQRCLHTYVNLSSGCNTFMSRLAQSQPGTHLNVHKCETKTFVVCCRLLHTSIDCLHIIAALFNDVCIPM